MVLKSSQSRSCRIADEEPPPAEDPRVRAAALDARFERVLLGLEAGRRDQDLMVELIATGRRYAENTAATERLLAAQFSEERSFAAGVADNVELLDSQAALTHARDARVSALARYQAARISLALALGRMKDFSF